VCICQSFLSFYWSAEFDRFFLTTETCFLLAGGFANVSQCSASKQNKKSAGQAFFVKYLKKCIEYKCLAGIQNQAKVREPPANLQK